MVLERMPCALTRMRGLAAFSTIFSASFGFASFAGFAFSRP
jgi:hypothetical protein